jgi:CO/xanthine dehydrogenase FAD-binding subunit
VKYLKARDLGHALEKAAGAAGERVKYLAGGTDLCVQIADGILDPTLLIDISSVGELRGLAYGAEGSSIGAAVTIAELLETAGSPEGRPADPVRIPDCLLQGAAAIGSPQIRNLATIGGNVCNASPCGDTLAPLIVLAAVFSLRSDRGSRDVPAEAFFRGPKATVLKPGEILDSILIPASHLGGRSAFRMIGKRSGQAISQVNVAVWLEREPGAGAGGRIRDIRIAAGSVAPIPLRLDEAEQLLRGKVPEPSLLQAAAEAVQEQIRPISDVRTSRVYRRRVTAPLFLDAMAEVLEGG